MNTFFHLMVSHLLLLVLHEPSAAISAHLFSVRVEWGDGHYHSNCSCNASGVVRWPQGWAASQPDYGGSAWSSSKSFPNPLPANMRVSSVQVDLFGRFTCSPNVTTFSVVLQSEEFATMRFQPNPSGCSGCLSCGYMQVARSTTYGVLGFPGFNSGPGALNTLSLKLQSGLLLLNAADIHLYAVVYGGDNDSTIKMPKWEFIAIIVSTSVGCCIFVSSFCFGVILFLRWRHLRRQQQLLRLIEQGGAKYGPSTIPTYYESVNVTSAGLVDLEYSRLASRSGPVPKGNVTQRQSIPPQWRGSIDALWRTSNQEWTKQIRPEEIQILELVGRGSFGDVYKGVWNGTVVAVKKLPFFFSELKKEDSAAFLDNFFKEAAMMKSLHHPNILQLFSLYLEPPDVCLVMEYMSRGSLHKILHDSSIQLDWPIICKILLDTAKGMAYLHSCEPIVIHRDLKSHNLLIDENWNCKVCDFGLAKTLTSERITTSQMTPCGTPSWTAPEVLRNERYSEKADVFSFGIVMWECITREDPYAGMPPFQVVLEVGSKHLRPEMPKSAPSALRELIGNCLTEDPARRPSFQEIVHMLTLSQVHMSHELA